MSIPEPDRRSAATALPEADRRSRGARAGLAGWWWRLKGALTRPLRIERRGLHLHLVLVDRRAKDGPFRPGSEFLMLADLEARLLALDPDDAGTGVRQLVQVHDELKHKGWRGVEELPALDLARALAQAEVLQSLERSRPMRALIERLRILRTGAELREERRAKSAQAVADAEGAAPERGKTGVDVFPDTVRDFSARRAPASGEASDTTAAAEPREVAPAR